jgi:arylsulfatase A-like enzyme
MLPAFTNLEDCDEGRFFRNGTLAFQVHCSDSHLGPEESNGRNPSSLKMKSNIVTFCVCVFAIFVVSSVLMGRHDPRPNILIIYTDDQSLDEVQAYGGAVLTPHLDSLAEEGVRLERYYAVSPVCSPSRYNLLTGRYASRCVHLQELFPSNDIGFIRWNTHLEGKEKTVAHLLSQAGYRTALAGKHHNSQNERHQIRVSPEADPRDPKVVQNLKRNHDVLTEMIRNHMGFGEVINVIANNFHVLDLPEELQIHNPEWIVDGAIQFMRRNQDNPFFLHIGLTIPHGPDNIESMRSDPRATPRGYLESAPRVQPPREDVFKRVSEAGLPVSRAHITWLDDSVGALLSELERLGIRENTLVIFASDHSDYGKMTCYERGVRTPGIVSWPAVLPEGRVEGSLTANVDWTPTILAAAQVTKGDEYIIDGENLLPLLKGEVDSVRDHLFLEICFTKGVVTEDWKYIATRFSNELQELITPENRHEFNQEGLRMTIDPIAGPVRSRYNIHHKYPGYFDDDQLYHLATDPDERTNLVGVERAHATLNQLRNWLREFQADKPHAFGEFGGGQ